MTTYRTNRLLQVAWRGGVERSGTELLTARTYVDSRRQFVIDHLETLQVMEFALSRRSEDELVSFIREEFGASQREARDVLEDLVDGDFLLPADHDLFDRTEEWFEKNWRRALYFHLGTSQLDYADDKSDPESQASAREELLDDYREAESPPPLYTPVDESAIVTLPEPDDLPDEPLAETLVRRETTRNFSEEPMDAQELSTLLFHAFDQVREVRDRIQEHVDEAPHFQLVSTPLPFEVYLIVMRNEDVDEGVYRYSIERHALSPIDPIADREAADDLVCDLCYQPYPSGGAVTCLFTTRFDQEQWRYRHSKAFRGLHVKVPTHAHRLILVATAVGCGAFQTPALKDRKTDETVGVDSFRNPVSYLVTVGKT